MSLWIQPLVGDLMEIPFSPPTSRHQEGWRPIYRFLHDQIPFLKEKALHQLRLFHQGSMDLSGVKEGDVLHLLITEPMVEKWISEYTISSPPNVPIPSYIFHHSTMSWLDARWGDPYEKPILHYRTPLTLHVEMREDIANKCKEYQINPEYFKERYPPLSPSDVPKWYATLRDALRAVQEKKSNGEEMTDKTIEHLVHLWELYHGTNEHLVRQGRYYE